MTLVVIGPVSRDLVIIGDDEYSRVGGATYFQSFVFEEFFSDYLAVVNCSDDGLVEEFPNSDKVKVISKDETHYFINEYPFGDNLDIRKQSSNFAGVPILRSDLEGILPEDIEGFVLNPLNRHDFPIETVEFLKSFEVPIFMSLQGLLRVPDVEVNENYMIKLDSFDELTAILKGVFSIFMDESEASIVGGHLDVDEMVITNGSHGSRIVSSDNEIKIDAVSCDNIVDTTGCGDTYMAAYVSQRLKAKSPKEAGKFASLIASEKINYLGPYRCNK